MYTLQEDISQFYQSSNTNSTKFSCEYCEELLHGSLKCGELEGLKRDVMELTHMLHITNRLTIKEVIQMDIDILLVKIESLKDIISEQFETDLSWAKVTARKHKKSTCIGQRVTHHIQVISNHYNLLCNDMSGEKPQNNAERLRDLNSKGISRDKMKNHKWRVLEKKLHKVIIISNSHARGRASKVKLLHNDFEVLGFVNPGSGMKFIKEKVADLDLKEVCSFGELK